VGVIFSVSFSPHAHAQNEIAIARIACRNGADFLHVFTYPHLGRWNFDDKLVSGVGATLSPKSRGSKSLK
jgi:hypothetical protein